MIGLNVNLLWCVDWIWWYVYCVVAPYVCLVCCCCRKICHSFSCLTNLFYFAIWR